MWTLNFTIYVNEPDDEYAFEGDYVEDSSDAAAEEYDEDPEDAEHELQDVDEEALERDEFDVKAQGFREIISHVVSAINSATKLKHLSLLID